MFFVSTSFLIFDFVAPGSPLTCLRTTSWVVGLGIFAVACDVSRAAVLFVELRERDAVMISSSYKLKVDFCLVRNEELAGYYISDSQSLFRKLNTLLSIQ